MDFQSPSFAPDSSFILIPDGNFAPANDDEFFEKQEFIDDKEKEVIENINNDIFAARDLIEQIKQRDIGILDDIAL